ncbi:MICOS complex subunit Mic60 isoform X1 [Sitodiplosis mosellana]|uniref:MICOS complex subunit Mic60 isoform X1 n=1 Tax=Sitodiplosis mosellana TaxID=263140 RepID=UPI0024451587|nr:MICOS complex subunit Mic60 isoform X1 [Sitodiplosis mosellana]
MIRLTLKNNAMWNRSTVGRLVSRVNQHRAIHSNPHQLQEAGVGKYLIILAPFAAGAGVVAYAKSDEKFRKTLVTTVPFSDPLLKILLQEEGNAVSEASKSIQGATQKVIGVKDSIVGYFGDDKSAKPADKPAPVKSSSSSAVASPPLPSITAPKPTASSPSESPATKKAAPPAKSKVVEEKPQAVPKPSEPIKLPPVLSQPLPQTFTDLEKDIEVAAQIAVKEYQNAIKLLKEYAEDVKTVVDRVIEQSDHSLWSVLKNKTSARDTAVEAAERTAQAAQQHIDKLEKHIKAVSKNVAPEIIEKTQRNITVIADQLSKSKDSLYEAKDSAKLSEKYWKKVEEARNYFIDQVQALFPGVDLSSKNLHLSKEDLDLFIVHAYSHVLAYQKELQKLNAEGETRLRRALDALKGEDQTEAVNRQIEYLLEKEKQALNIENQKKILRIQAENEAKLRKQLKVQSEAHSDHLQDALIEKEKELRRVFNNELSEKLSVEQSAYKIQLATMLGKLKGMDSALKEIEEELQARADADRQIHQSQALWSACSALWSSMRTVDSTKPWQDQLRPLDAEVEAVRRASEKDELVSVILDALPDKAKTRGVYPENAIRERFLKVERLARQLALVPAENATIVKYILSYLQAMLIIQPKELISQAELNNEPVDYAKLSTFEILDRTRYCVDRGNFTQALRYANLLQGASRNIATDWINETRLLLETQQAINVLLAHAATSGLAFL